MKRTPVVMILFLCAMLVWVPLAPPSLTLSFPQISIQNKLNARYQMSPSQTLNTKTGTLNPVIVEHFGSASGYQPYMIGRTDTESTPGSEVFSPVGAQGNLHSADCSGGYFLVGAGGSANFSSSQGTLSLWIRWDVTAPHGRFWGQHLDFETRWSSNRFTLDWGGDTSIVGTKNDWVPHKWYFLAITWDDSSNQLALFWGDEDTEPVEDASTSSWTQSVVGLHTQNDIMNSAGRTNAQVDGHIDEFRYYTIQRNQEDLKRDYKMRLSGNEPGLAHYYEFEEDYTDSTGDAELIPAGSSSFSHDVFAGKDGWIAEQIEVDVRNVEYLHALNGTFENGNSGANVDWSGDGVYYANGWYAQREILSVLGRQRASYINTSSKYLAIENEGYEVTSPNGYRHYNGTSIYWYQIVDNSRQTDQFEFSMNYLYQRGPIGTNYSNIFEFCFEILNGSSVLWNWTIDPANITQRGSWYRINPITIDIPGAPSTFEIRVSLNVNTTSSYVEISETDSDLDGDSANGMFVTLLIDDVSLTAAQAVNLENVDFSIDIAELSSIPIVGSSGVGTILLNYSYWEKASIPFTFSSNSSVSFEYSAKTSRIKRYSNSTYSTNLENIGVSYNVEPGQSAALSLHTYIESYPEASEIGFTIHYPDDWENPKVEDPFGQNITDVAIVGTGTIEIPSGFASSVGWWEITLNGPNYADSIATQVQIPSDLSWNSESTFNGGNRIRCWAVIRTGSETLPNVTDVEINWHDPNGGI
ncbi:MAG: LamG-like jellyroll fold domain-containing protein, partial [Candidatus Thorarchaeota archaeon]